MMRTHGAESRRRNNPCCAKATQHRLSGAYISATANRQSHAAATERAVLFQSSRGPEPTSMITQLTSSREYFNSLTSRADPPSRNSSWSQLTSGEPRCPNHLDLQSPRRRLILWLTRISSLISAPTKRKPSSRGTNSRAGSRLFVWTKSCFTSSNAPKPRPRTSRARPQSRGNPQSRKVEDKSKIQGQVRPNERRHGEVPKEAPHAGRQGELARQALFFRPRKTHRTPLDRSHSVRGAFQRSFSSRGA